MLAESLNIQLSFSYTVMLKLKSSGCLTIWSIAKRRSDELMPFLRQLSKVNAININWKLNLVCWFHFFMFYPMPANKKSQTIEECMYLLTYPWVGFGPWWNLSGVLLVWIQSFPSLWSVAILRLKNHACSIYAYLGWEEMDSCLSRGHPIQDWTLLFIYISNKNNRRSFYGIVANMPTPTTSLQTGKTLSMSVLDMTLNNLMVWLSNSGTLGNMEYSIYIAPSSLWPRVVGPDWVLSVGLM